MDRAEKSGQVREQTYQDLVKVEKPGKPGEFYPNWSENPITKKKVWRKGGVTIRTPHTSLREAEKYRDAEIIRRSGLNPATVKRKRQGVTNPLIRDIWTDLVTSRTPKRSPGTLRKYEQSWRHAIEPFWGDKTIDQVNQATQYQFETWYMENRPTKQYFNVNKHLGMLFRYMDALRLIDKVPDFEDLDVRIDLNVRRAAPGRVYTKAEQRALLSATVTPYEAYQGKPAQLWIWQYRAGVSIRFGLEGGVRHMEIAKLEREKLDLDNGVAEVFSDKNGVWRKVPMGPELIKAVRLLIRHTPDSKWLFPMPTDPAKHISYRLMDKAWNMAKERAGIKGGALEARHHDLRHTFATRTRKEKWSVIDACDVLDMTADEYQKTYAHRDHDDIKAEMSRTFGWKKKRTKK